MVATTLLEEHAVALAEAERTVTPIAPLSETDAGLTIEHAYAIQRHNVERRVAAGARIVGRKIGLTSAAMQRQLGVTEPDFGALLDDMLVEDGDAVATSALIAPKVEAELAFVMARDLAGPGVDAVTALTAVAGALPAIEIIDSRVADWKIRLSDRRRRRRARQSASVHRVAGERARRARRRLARGRHRARGRDARGARGRTG
jgi:2-keto-4-pentenoate hydratase